MKKSVEIQSFRAEEGKNRTRKEDAVGTLQKFRRCENFLRVVKFSEPSETFSRVAKLSTTFDFFSFFFIPDFSPFYSVYFVQFGNLNCFGGI